MLYLPKILVHEKTPAWRMAQKSRKNEIWRTPNHRKLNALAQKSEKKTRSGAKCAGAEHDWRQDKMAQIRSYNLAI